MATIKQKPYLASIFSRLGALLVDTIILVSFGLLLGLLFESQFVKMGLWAPLVGAFIMLLYFGIGNSPWANGQTLGKKLLNIQVVDIFGAPLNNSKACLRALVFIIPFALNGQPILGENPPIIFIALLSAIIFGGILSIVYLLIFNRNTRQSLHDLAAKSIVINKNADKKSIPPLWKGHLIVVALLFLAAALVPAVINNKIGNNAIKELVDVQKILSSDPSTRIVNVQQSTTTFIDTDGSQEITESLSIQMAMKKNDIENQDFAKSVAKKAYNQYALANKLDKVYVTLSYGYNIGIASKNSFYNYEFEPSELKK